VKDKIGINLMGRFGNQLFQYAFARGYARAHGCELETCDWIGRRVFDLNDPFISEEREVAGEEVVESGKVNVNLRCYAQNQKCADFYSREDVKGWFKIRDEVERGVTYVVPYVAIHLRRGDYLGSGYPVVGMESYLRALYVSDIGCDAISVYCDDFPRRTQGLASELGFLTDFIEMRNAEALLRANSSFSWWAATLGNGRVFSPVIDGLEGGKVHDKVTFVEGNHPKLADLGFISDIHLK
jgi:hypothetical protein